MNCNAELLNYLYQNSQMGTETLPKILERAVGKEFREHLQKQLEGYRSFHKKAEDMLNQNGFEEKEISGLQKMQTDLMLKIQTMMDSSDSHLAEMLIQGSNMGVTEAVKKMNQYENCAEKDILTLMKELQRFEERNIEKLKSFL